MARKPAPLEMAGGRGPRQRIWDAIRQARTFDLRQVCPPDVRLATARSYLISLERAGYLAHQATQSDGSKCYLLARDAGIEAPRLKRDGSPVTRGYAQEQMWRTMRIVGNDFNARELASMASTPEVIVSQIAAGDYLRNLAAAGYLDTAVRGQGLGAGGRLTRYRLVRNTGPRPPLVCRAECLYDPNIDQVVHLARLSEEDAVYGR